jgi:hypothetical protein
VSRGGEIVENEGEARLYPPLAPFNPPKNRAANHQSRARDAFFSSLLERAAIKSNRLRRHCEQSEDSMGGG